MHLYSEASLLYKITFFFFIPVSSSQLLLLVGLGYLFYWSYRSPVKKYWDYWHLLDSYSGNVHARPTTQIHCGYCLLRRRTKKYQHNVFRQETTYKFTVSWCAPFSHQKQEPCCRRWCSNPQRTTKTNEQPWWQMNVTMTTNEGQRWPGMSTDVPRCHCPHWSRWVIPVPLLLLTWKQGHVATCQPTMAKWRLTTTNNTTMSRWSA